MSGIEAAFFGALGRDTDGQKTSKNGKNYLRLNVRVGDGEGATWVSVLAFDPRAIEQADKFLKGREGLHRRPTKRRRVDECRGRQTLRPFGHVLALPTCRDRPQQVETRCRQRRQRATGA